MAKKANRIAGLHHKNQGRDKKVIIPRILHSVLVSAIQKRCGQVGKGPDKGDKDDQRTGKLPCEGRESWIHSALRIKGEETLYLTSAYREDGDSCLQADTCKRPMVIDTNYSCRE